jgi:MFS family permease
MDTTGAVIGPAIALVLLFFFHNNIRLVLYVAVIPTFLSLILFIWVKEARQKAQSVKMKLSLSLKNFPPELKMFLLGLCIFSLGNSSDSFLILRAKNLGLSLLLVISAYILYNIIYALSSTPAGAISDRIGTKKVFITGIVIFAFCYLGFALDRNGIFVWPLFAIYGFYIGLTDGVSKAMVGSLVGEEHSATAYGVMNTITSGFTLLASVIGGFLWSLVAPSATFYFAVICAVVSIPIFLLIKPKTSKAESSSG